MRSHHLQNGIAIIGLAVALWLAGPAATGLARGGAADPVSLAITPARAVFLPGDEFQVVVRADNVTALYGADIRLAFDPAHFAVVDANPSLPGVQITPESGLLAPDLVVKREADNATGAIWYAVVQLNPRPPASGSGPLFSFRLKALQAGSGVVTFAQQQLSTRDAELIPVDSLNSAAFIVRVGAGPVYEYAFPLLLRH